MNNNDDTNSNATMEDNVGTNNETNQAAEVPLTPAQIQNELFSQWLSSKGWNDTQEGVLIKANGIFCAEVLFYMRHDNIGQLFKTEGLKDVAFTAKLAFYSLWAWVKERAKQQLVVDMSEFNDAELKKAMLSLDKTDAPTGESDLKPPGHFNGEWDKWEKFSSLFKNYLTGTNNQEGIPLVYVLRDPEDYKDFVEGPDEPPINRLIRVTPHHGPKFRQDNNRVLP